MARAQRGEEERFEARLEVIDSTAGRQKEFGLNVFVQRETVEGF